MRCSNAIGSSWFRHPANSHADGTTLQDHAKTMVERHCRVGAWNIEHRAQWWNVHCITAFSIAWRGAFNCEGVL
jgi:hypothetical protein